MRALLLAVVAALVLAAPAYAGELIDAAAGGLGQSNVYVDPGADPTLSSGEVDELERRIASERAGPMYIVVAPSAISREAGGDPSQALLQIADKMRQNGTYVLVAGRTIRALSNTLDEGVAGDLAGEAAGAHKGEGVAAVLDDLVSRVGEARQNGGKPPGNGMPGTGGFIFIGLLAAGAVAIATGRRRRRRAQAAEFDQAKANARDDLVALGDDIRALDLDASMPAADPQAKADYDHAVQRYTEA